MKYQARTHDDSVEPSKSNMEGVAKFKESSITNPAQLQMIVDSYTSNKAQSNEISTDAPVQLAINVNANVREGAVVIKAEGKAKEFKDGDKAGDYGWNRVEKYFARYKVNDEQKKIGPLNNKYLRAEAGHVLAQQNGGLGSQPDNVFAQDGGVNNSTYRKDFENPMNTAIKKAKPDDPVSFRAVLYGDNITKGKLIRDSDELERSEGEYDATSSEDDSSDISDDEELTYEEWMKEVANLVYEEYERELDDLPDEPYRMSYEDGYTPEEFYNEYMRDGKAY